MANHRTSRFQNTFNDLYDCIEFLKENGNYTNIRDLNNLSETEMNYALRLGNLCREFLEFTENQEENDFCPEYIKNVAKNLNELQTIPAIDEALERLSKTEFGYSNLIKKLKEEND